MSFGAGASYTIGSIIDRLLVQWLSPPDSQFAQCTLGANVTDTATTSVTVGVFAVPEDELLLRQGSIIEAGAELMRVTAYDSISKVATVVRGEYGTPKSTHSTPLMLNINPPYPRAAIFEAVSDNIITLYPSLFTTKQELLASVGTGVFPIADDLAVTVLSVQPGDFTSSLSIHGEIVDFHPMVGDRSLLINRADVGTVWLRYRRRMAKPTAETDTLEDCGVDDRWVTIVMAGAAADLLAGRDIPETHSEWVSNVLEAETVRVGTRMSVAGGLRQYRNLLIDDAKKEMKAEYKPTVRMRDALRQFT